MIIVGNTMNGIKVRIDANPRYFTHISKYYRNEMINHKYNKNGL